MLEETTPGDSLLINAFGFMPLVEVISAGDTSIAVTLFTEAYSLDEVTIKPTLDALHLLSDIHLETHMVNSSQDLLRLVPGLVIGQHAGGGKAEQMFLRGFDLDHGTDIAISVDGMPVNMVSHAHGQGYADLHFLIPETIDRLRFGKGPYYVDQGNLATAGYVEFKTLDRIEENLLQFEKGQFETQRILGMFSISDSEHSASYLATEFQMTDGPFVSPQNFSRFNAMFKNTTHNDKGDQLGLTASYFTSTWDASGQIPERAVESGMITRFGAIDDTEGGTTSRANLQLHSIKQTGHNAFLKTTGYFTDYRFELYSNFTFFLEDSVNGDQIRQKEQRALFGLQSEFNQSLHLQHAELLLQGSIGFRRDESDDNELSHTAQRSETITSIQLGDIEETNFFTYLNAKLDFEKWSFNGGLRWDQIEFGYVDKLSMSYTHLTDQKAVISPKLNIAYQPSKNVQVYAQFGQGFHSNDTRGVVLSSGLPVMPKANGTDLGLLWKPIPALAVQFAAWHLYLEQEFVYVGDAGVVEPGAPSRRNGLDLSLQYQPYSWLYAHAELNAARARTLDQPEGEDFIPLAPGFIATGGFQVKTTSGILAGFQVRHIDDRPANEDRSIMAEGYTVMDIDLGYQWRKFEFNVQIQNLLNTEWNETQFATRSRLKDEPEPIEEIHFTPGTPFFLKGSVGYRF